MASLRALLDHAELGGGFKLAMSDLQIRGGGNILGVSQSGHIAAVGYDLYLELLQNTVADLKRKVSKKEIVETVDPEINLQISAYLPDNYIYDTAQRYIAYRKIAGVEDCGQLADFKEELEDRYGLLPTEAQNLVDMMALKVRLKKLMINSLEQGRDMLIFSFHESTPVPPQKILGLVEKAEKNMRFTPGAKLMVPLAAELSHSPQAILHAANEIVDALDQYNP